MVDLASFQLTGIQAPPPIPTEEQNSPLPKVLYIELADYCNLSCTFCERSAYVESVGPGGFIDVEMLKKLEQPIRAAEVLGLSGRIGEPLLHPKLETILRWAYDINPKIRLRITTNGTALSAKMAELLGGHIDFLAISLNAANAEAYFRDMRPVGQTRHDPRAWWANLIRRISEFMGALSPADRKRIRMIAPVRRENIEDAPDFVRLVHSMGCSHAIVTPMYIHEYEKIDSSVYWMKDRYNNLMDAAAALGSRLGVRVEAARFYTNPKPENLDLEALCREPVESAYLNMEKLGKTAPCCHWSEDALPMDVYSDSGAFERFWNSDTYRRLRAKRDFRSCKNCGMGRAFDEMLFHLTPALQYRLAADNRTPDVEVQNLYPDSELVRVCRDLSLDLRSLRRTVLTLGLPVDILDSVKHGGLDALLEIDRACWSAFIDSKPVALEGVAYDLGGCFTGIGWFDQDMDPESRVSARWMGGARTASVFARVPPGFRYQLRVTAHHLRSSEMTNGLSLKIYGHPIEMNKSLGDDGIVLLTAVVPEECTREFDGCLHVEVGYREPHGHQGWVSFSSLELTKLEGVAKTSKIAKSLRNAWKAASPFPFGTRRAQP